MEWYSVHGGLTDSGLEPEEPLVQGEDDDAHQAVAAPLPELLDRRASGRCQGRIFGARVVTEMPLLAAPEGPQAIGDPDFAVAEADDQGLCPWLANRRGKA